MNVYKVTYHTISKGKDPNGKAGNILQFTGTAFIETENISDCNKILKEYYKNPIKEIYYVPIIKTIELQKYSIILKKKIKTIQDNDWKIKFLVKNYEKLVKDVIPHIKQTHKIPCDGDCEICAMVLDFEELQKKERNKNEKQNT